MSNEAIRILVVDDHEVIRKSIQSMLGREPDMQVVAMVANGREAIHSAKTTDPDVIIMDVSMPELDGIRAAGMISELGIPAQIIMLSMHYNSALVHQARTHGAAGYILKQKANSELVPAVRAAFAGALSL